MQPPHPLAGLDPLSHELPLSTPAYIRTAIHRGTRQVLPAPTPLASLASHLHQFQPATSSPPLSQFASPPATLAPGGAPILFAVPAQGPIDLGTLHSVRMWQCWRLARALAQKRIVANPLPSPRTPPYRASYTDPTVPLEWLPARSSRAAGWFAPASEPDPETAQDDLLEAARARLTAAAAPLPPSTPLTLAEARVRIQRGIDTSLQSTQSFLRVAQEALATILPPAAPLDLEHYQTHQDTLLEAYCELVREASMELRIFYPPPTPPHSNWPLWSTAGLARADFARAAWSTPDELQATEISFVAWQMEQAKAFKSPLEQHDFLARTLGCSPQEMMLLITVGRDANKMLHQRDRQDKEIETSTQLLEVARTAADDSVRLRAITERARVEGLTDKRAVTEADAEDLIAIMIANQKRVDEERSAPQIEAKPNRVIDILPAIPDNNKHLTPDQRKTRWEH